MKQETMRVLVVEPGKRPMVREIPEWEQREHFQNCEKIAAYESAFSTIMQSMKK